MFPYWNVSLLECFPTGMFPYWNVSLLECFLAGNFKTGRQRVFGKIQLR
jgi:hypothetical protein